LNPSRRFLALAGLIGVLIAPLPVTGVEPAAGEPYRLRFHHLHTGERLDVVYRNADGYDPAALTRIDRLLRDWRKDEIHPYDPRVLDLLRDLLASLGRPDAEIQVICGYRAPATNESLRQAGHDVARHSMHLQAMAIDIRVPGVPTSVLRDAALRLGRGGVGYYAASDFVHVDVGRVRRW
jgi:uncharacterized protein YcbK (DUF882 family)